MLLWRAARARRKRASSYESPSLSEQQVLNPRRLLYPLSRWLSIASDRSALYCSAEQALDQLLIRDSANEKAGQELIKSISCFNTREIYP